MKTDTPLLPKLWTGIPDAIRNRLGRDPGPQRAMYEEEHLLIILHQIPGPDELQRRPALFWRLPDGTWKSTPTAGGLGGLQEHLAAYASKLDEFDKAEQIASSAVEYHRLLEEVTPVLRSSRGLHRALQQAREAVKADRDLINLRDQAAGIERNAELVQQDAQFGLNFLMVKQAEVQAENSRRMSNASHRINILAAIFLPLTAITGLFGMNVQVPLPDSLESFYLITVVGVVIGLILTVVMVSSRKG